MQETRFVSPPLRYRLGEYTLWTWKPSLVPVDCRENGAVGWDEQDPKDLDPGADGLLCRTPPAAGLLPGLHRRTGWLVYVQRVEKAYYVEIRGTFEDYLRRFNAKRRNDLKRNIRRFQEMRSGSPLTVATRPEEMEEFHRRAVEISRHTYQEKMFRAGMPEGKDFLKQMVELAAQGLARGYLLWGQDKPVAYAWCAGRGRRLNYVVIGYLPEYAKLSPGTALQYLLLQDLFSEKSFDLFSFGAGDIWYKEYFSTGYEEFVDAILVKPTWRNWVLLSLHALLEKTNDIASALLGKLGLKRAVKLYMRKLAGVSAPEC